MKKKPKQGGWYVCKHFPHFDLPLDFEAARQRVEDKKWVASRSFWPFLGFEDRKRRFRTQNGQRIVDTKSRPIKYCAHQDGYIYAYYAHQLQIAYESYLSGKTFAASVIGYRRGIGSNIGMACAAFQEIRKRRKAAAICLDISSFFDNIDHKILKNNLMVVLGVSRLSDDWLAVFRSMTRYTWVDAEELQERLQIDPNKPPRPLCSAVEFRRKIRGDGREFTSLLKPNPDQHGIPQGSPISAVFSNVFMIGFDEAVDEYVRMLGGSYRRYSDDIMIVCAPSRVARVNKFIDRQILKLGGFVQISKEKTEISLFKRRQKSMTCDRPITYLGFTFDGRRITLRGRTLSRYYRRVTYATRHATTRAKEQGDTRVFKRKLYRDFTHLGTDNFYSYAKRSAVVMNDPAAKRQLRRHFRILHRKLDNRGR